MEIREICVDLDNPVRLHKYDGANVNVADWFGKEWLELHPGNDIMQGPRGVEEDGADREPPSIDR